MTRSHILVLLALSLQAQDAPRPRFEVASVKPDPPSALRHVIYPPSGNRFHTSTASVRLLIQRAYGVQPFEISGGPDWMNSDGYTIDAKAEGNPAQSQMWLMLQSLLEDRFKLKIHREMKELPVYTLTAAKSGLNLPKAKEGDCTDLGTVPSSSRSDPHPISGPCGDPMLGADPTEMFVRGRQVAMADFARLLAGITGRPVLDKTGITEKVDVNLAFECDDFSPGIPCPRRPADYAPKPSITAALQQQLGLKMESAKGPVAILIIDRLERPTEN